MHLYSQSCMSVDKHTEYAHKKKLWKIREEEEEEEEDNTDSHSNL